MTVLPAVADVFLVCQQSMFPEELLLLASELRAGGLGVAVAEEGQVCEDVHHLWPYCKARGIQWLVILDVRGHPILLICPHFFLCLHLGFFLQCVDRRNGMVM